MAAGFPVGSLSLCSSAALSADDIAEGARGGAGAYRRAPGGLMEETLPASPMSPMHGGASSRGLRGPEVRGFDSRSPEVFRSPEGRGPPTIRRDDGPQYLA